MQRCAFFYTYKGLLRKIVLKSRKLAYQIHNYLKINELRFSLIRECAFRSMQTSKNAKKRHGVKHLRILRYISSFCALCAYLYNNNKRDLRTGIFILRKRHFNGLKISKRPYPPPHP